MQHILALSKRLSLNFSASSDTGRITLDERGYQNYAQVKISRRNLSPKTCSAMILT